MTKNNPPTNYDQARDSADESVMTAATLAITVNFTTATGFTFHLQHSDASGMSWTHNLSDNATVAFVNNGQYELFNAAGAAMFFTFNAVSVALGSSLAGTSSKVCGSTVNFKFSNIQFPILKSEMVVANLYAWCQSVPPTAADTGPRFVDPKLGLSNSKGSSGFHIPTSTVSCSCSS